MTFRYTIHSLDGHMTAGFGSLTLATQHLKKLDKDKYYLVVN